MKDAVAAGHHLNLAHGLATARIRSINPQLKTGITNIVTDIQAREECAADRDAARRLDAANNRFFLDPVYTGRYSQEVHALFDELGLNELVEEGDLAIISADTDFAGVNHYQRVIVWADEQGGFLQLGERPAEPATTSFGWSVIPESLSNVLERVSRDYTRLPLFVTENGASYHDYVDPSGRVMDTERIEYFGGYLNAAGDALAKGVNLQGYFAWSFLDNYEWAEGYSKRFGLVFLDYGTQARIPKATADWYSAVIRAHARSIGVLASAERGEPA